MKVQRDSDPARWPIAPALALYPSRRRLCEALGISGQTLRQILAGTQKISTTHADRAALGAGVHPAQIWPDWDRLDPDEAFAVDALDDTITEAFGADIAALILPVLVEWLDETTAAMERRHGTRRSP